MLDKLTRLARSHGPLQPGRGIASGVVALVLAALCFLGVLVFHFPQYLSTPQLRATYDVDVMRELLYWSMVVSGGIALFNIAFGRTRWLASAAFVLVLLAALLGGHKVPVRDFAGGTPYIGLDWFVLDLLGSALLFVFIEKLFGLRREQPVFRAEWQTDLHHFIVNHMAVGFLLLATNLLVHRLFGWAVQDGIQAWIRSLPFPAALVLIVLVADLVQYWVHRAYHEVPWLWRLHAVHHSVKTMDWLAGSRQHVVEVLLTRALVLGPIFVLGFSKEVIDAYIVIVGFHAVFNHANVSVRLGPLRHVIVTPNFHHWHHAQDAEAIDRNYAAHFAFLDHLFGTAVRSGREWPARYGVVGDSVPEGFLRQLAYPFRGRRRVSAGSYSNPVAPPTSSPCRLGHSRSLGNAPLPGHRKEHAMNSDQVKGRAKEVKGDLKEAAGKALDDKDMQREGNLDQAEGKVQKSYGDVKHDVGQSIDKGSNR